MHTRLAASALLTFCLTLTSCGIPGETIAVAATRGYVPEPRLIGGERVAYGGSAGARLAFVAEKLLSDGGSLWGIDRGRRAIVRFDPRSGAVRETVEVPQQPVACDPADFLLEPGESLWVGCRSAKLLRISLSTRAVDRVVRGPSGGTLFGLVVAGDHVVMVADEKTRESSGWVAFHSRTSGGTTSVMLYRASIAYYDVHAQADARGELAGVDVVGPDRVMVTYTTGAMLLVGQSSIEVLAEGLTAGIVDTAYLDGVLWTLNRETGVLTRMLPAKKRVSGTVQVGTGGGKLLHTGRVLWVLLGDRLVQVNPLDGSRLGETAVGLALADITFDGSHVISVEAGTGRLRQH